MMRKIILGTVVCLSVCLSISGLALADERQNTALKAVNDEVQRRADVLQYEHNIIVTQTDRDNIKKTVIVEKLRVDTSEATARDKVDAAIQTFEITDATEQRDLFIAYSSGGGSGARPPE